MLATKSRLVAADRIWERQQYVGDVYGFRPDDMLEMRRLADVALGARAAAPAPREPSDVLRFSGDRFPLQTAEGKPKSVPWVMVAPHEKQAQANHSQSLKRLAERHGLDPQELWCVVHDRPWDRRATPEQCDAWLSGINDLRFALVVAAQAEQAQSQTAPEGAAL